MNISTLIQEYNGVLLRDLGFTRWREWEPLITTVTETLGVTEDLSGMTLSEAHREPGVDILGYLITSWLKGRGKHWEKLFFMTRTQESSPYEDVLVYRVRIKSPAEVVSELSGREAYDDYEIIKRMFWSQEYQTLRTLDGLEVRIK